MSMLINRRDLDFQLFEWLNVAGLCENERYQQHDRETFDAILDAAYQLAENRFADHAAKVDENEPTFDGKTVTIIPEVQAALDAYIESGFMGAGFSEELGGMQLPVTIAQAVAALFTAANVSTVGYAFLTIAAANMLNTVGSDEQKAKYLGPMLDGRFFGTMCLSEPQAGSSLGDIRTTAYPQEDGSYKIKGNKMWISGGEHELSENIIHMVLAKIEGAPVGSKGISLFLVPKKHIADDGTVGEKNGVRLIGLNHKMGYRGTVNTALSFGDNDDCTGWLVGEPNKGLAGMFHMMNEARIGVGLGAASIGYSGYLHSLDYAKTRPQGRPIDKPDQSQKPVMIIEHADVRRNLLKQKAFVEAGMGLCLMGAQLVDKAATTTSDAERDESNLLLEMLTPIIKTWPSENCLEANKLAIQILGGYGYTRDYPLERLYRDNRLNPIHEGTTGIQGLDLLGRKVMMKGGAGFKLLLAKMAETVSATPAELGEYSAALGEAVQTLAKVTEDLSAFAIQGNVKRFMANSNEYLEMAGHIVIAWVWLQQAITAQAAMESAAEVDQDFYRGKLTACQYFYRWELPKIGHWAALLSSGDETCLNADEAIF